MARPLISATAPPVSRYSCSSRSRSSSPTCTAAGVSAKSMRVPSRSKKYAHSRCGGGGLRGLNCRSLASLTHTAGHLRQTAAPAHRSGIHQHAPRPAEYVEILNQAAHQPHTRALLRARHREGELQRGGALIGVVGIHDQCFRQLTRGAGEEAEDQHTPFVVTRRNEFFRDEIHAVVEARDHAEIGAAIILE